MTVGHRGAAREDVGLRENYVKTIIILYTLLHRKTIGVGGDYHSPMKQGQSTIFLQTLPK